MTINNCIICGKQPEKLITKSHVAFYCKDDDIKSDGSYHDIMTSGSKEFGCH